MTDETPWAQLASLALFKLFNDWQAQGYAVPPELLRTPDYFNNQQQGQATGADMDLGDGEDTGEGGEGTLETPQAPPQAPFVMPQMPQMPPVVQAQGPVSEEQARRHPVQLINELHKGGVIFQLLEENGAPPRTEFVMGVELNGQAFRGEGRSKKEAKKQCAIKLLKEVHGIEYAQEEQL